MDPAKLQEQLNVLHELACDTHVFWPPEEAQKFMEPFGFKVHTHVEHASKHPKGLTLNNGAKSAEGAASWDISGQLVQELNLTSEGKLGRGSQVRADVDAVFNHLKTQLPEGKVIARRESGGWDVVDAPTKVDL
jgi:hypothetical protein